MTNNKHIDTYNTVYDVDIVVANKEVTLEELQKLYIYSNNEELDEDVVNYQASTARCKNKDTNKPVVLIKYNRPSTVKGLNTKLELINTAAHEALHAIMDIYSYIGEKINPDDSNETTAYLLGWLTSKVYETWTKK